MKKIRGMAAFLLTNIGSNTTFSQTMFKTFFLLRETGSNENLHEISPYIFQALNFFIIGPLDNKATAAQQIELTLIMEKKFDHEVYKIFQEEKFEPAELIAGVAYFFRNISALHFDERSLIEKESFQLRLDIVNMNSRAQVLEVFPDILMQFNLFHDYFKKNYMSPWNPARYSEHKTRANFGTGIDYIMK